MQCIFGVIFTFGYTILNEANFSSIKSLRYKIVSLEQIGAIVILHILISSRVISNFYHHEGFYRQ